MSYLIAAVVVLPILVILIQWGTVGNGEQAIWQHLFDTKLDRLLLNTLNTDAWGWIRCNVGGCWPCLADFGLCIPG